MSQENKITLDVDEKQTRAYQITQSAFDDVERTIEVAFSSETPLLKKDKTGREYFEILSHNPEDVKLDWINSGRAPLLIEHDPEDQVGVVESARIDEDRVGRAIIRFSKTPEVDSLWADVKDRIKTNVSVGYAYKISRIEEIDGRIYAYCSWAPYEISIVSIPADMAKSGVGRSQELNKTDSEISVNPDLEKSDKTNPERLALNTDPEKSEEKTDVTKTNQTNLEKRNNNNMTTETLNIEEVRKAEIDRQKSINAFGARHAAVQGVKELTQKAIESGETVDGYRAALLDILPSATPDIKTNLNHLDMSAKETRSFSMGRALVAAHTGDWSQAGLEREAAQELAKRYGESFNPREAVVPDDVLSRVASLRGSRAAGIDATTYVDNQSVGVKTRGSWVEALWSQSISDRLGVTAVPVASGLLELPRVKTVPTAEFVDEGEDGAVSKSAFDTVNLIPKTIITLSELTESMLTQAPEVEGIIFGNMQKAISKRLDQAVFAAILADADISFVPNIAAAADVNYAAIKKLIKKLRNTDGITDTCQFAMNPDVADFLESLLQSDNSIAKYIRGEDGRIAGYQSQVSNNVGIDNALFFGDFSKVYVGYRGPLKMAVDTSQLFDSVGYKLRLHTQADVKIVQPGSITAIKSLAVV